MKLVVAGHIAIDTIQTDDCTVNSIGGPPCYVGLTAKKLGCNVELITKVGYDFTEEYFVWLSKNGLTLEKNFHSKSYPTTRFKFILTENNMNRKVILQAKCQNLDLNQLDSIQADGMVINSIVGEISSSFIEKADGLVEHLFLDPQGHLRSFTDDGSSYLEPKIDFKIFKHIDMIKIGKGELMALTGTTDRDTSMNRLKMKGVGNMIFTATKGDVWVVFEDNIHIIPIPKTKPVDTTGAGDIFVGAYEASFLKDGDALWASCMGMSASYLSLSSSGISKIPPPNSVQEYASKILETAKKKS